MSNYPKNLSLITYYSLKVEKTGTPEKMEAAIQLVPDELKRQVRRNVQAILKAIKR